jgi:hypothetical protein
MLFSVTAGTTRDSAPLLLTRAFTGQRRRTRSEMSHRGLLFLRGISENRPLTCEFT